MRSIGYTCVSRILNEDCLTSINFDQSASRFRMVDQLIEEFRPYAERFVDDVTESISELEPHVDSWHVSVNDNRLEAFRDFLRYCTFDAIVVDSLKQISVRTNEQLGILQKAREEPNSLTATGQRVLIITTEQSSLLKLDLDMAFVLQDQWIVAPLSKALDDSSGKAEDNYIKLRDLMLERLTVEKIAERLGQSKSTIFRWRKQYEERLSMDVPGFKKGS